MADPQDDPLVVEAMRSPSAWRQLPDPPDTGGALEIEEEKESSSFGGKAGCSGGGEDGMEVTVPSSDCTMAAALSQDLLTGVNPLIVLSAEIVALDSADRYGDWVEAIENKDCLSLLKILEAENDLESRTSLCWEKSEQGRSALHVAAMQGCFRLAKQVIDLVCEEYSLDEERFTESVPIDGIEHAVHMSGNAYSFIHCVDIRSGLSAFEMANDIIGNTSISQYILYVGSKSKDDYSGMYEAYEGTEWHTALAGGDCEALSMMLFKCNSRWLLETCGGLSVLDVVILRGHDELVKQVMELFSTAASDGDPEICWDEESYFPSKLKWNQIAKRSLRSVSAEVDFFPGVKRRKRLQSVKSASDLAEQFGKSEIKELLRNEPAVRECASMGPHAVKAVQYLLGRLSRAGVFGTDYNLDSMYRDVELVPLESRQPEFPSLLRWAATIEDEWEDGWTAGFLLDVDYNFEDRRSLRFSILRLHYACKHPRQCLDFLSRVRDSLYDQHRKSRERFLVDGQGRTPLHTMVDHYYPNDEMDALMKSWILSGPLNLEHDSRGRSPMIRAITKLFLKEESMVSSHLLQVIMEDNAERLIMKSIEHVKLRDGSQSNVLSMVEGLYLGSFLYEDVNVLRFLTSKEEYKNGIKAFLDTNHWDSPRLESLKNWALFTAAARGNQALLREWFKFKCDCMVEDIGGRTTLHYAADGNGPQYVSPPTSFFCAIVYPRKVKEKWEKNHLTVDKGNENIDGHTNGTSQSSASVGRKACILMLLQAGVDLSQVDKTGNIPDPGASNDTEFQEWWYHLVVKDSEDKKKSFNEAGNALSVVGTLVAATSYIGPLQPPLNYTHTEHNGYVDTSRSLVKVFMWTNTLAFYLAVASVMFAVVPSLPMPQEGVLDELRRARHTVSSSLFLLLASIGCMLVSFAAATAVVVDNTDYYEANDFLLSPSVIGWFFCVIAMISFFIRVMRLVFYRSPIIRQMYNFSFNRPLKLKYRRIIGIPMLFLLFIPAVLEVELIQMIELMGRVVRRVCRVQVRHQELERPTRSRASPQRQRRSIFASFLLWLVDWVELENRFGCLC